MFHSTFRIIFITVFKYIFIYLIFSIDWYTDIGNVLSSSYITDADDSDFFL